MVILFTDAGKITKEVSATEQKTILEELIEDAPAQRERRRKLQKAKHCISREEWDEADALLAEIIEAHPDDEEARQELRILNEKILAAERRQREAEEREAAEREKEEQRRLEEEKRRLEREAAERRVDTEEFSPAIKEEKEQRPDTGRPRRSFGIILLVLLMVAAAVAAVLGISAHRQSVQDQLDADNIVITDTFDENVPIED